MIGTHTSKLTNPKAQQNALSAEIIGEINPKWICSSTVDLEKKFFACPKNAADISKWKLIAAEANHNKKNNLNYFLPDITDGRFVKQILLPLDDSYENYVNASPVESLGLLREVWIRSKELEISPWRYILEPTPSAYANHGELMLDQAGRLALLMRRIDYTVLKRGAKTTCVALIADITNINIGAGWIGAGFPAITGVGGLVHALERNIGAKIAFAIGFKSLECSRYTLGTNYARKTQKNLITKPRLISELNGNGQVVLLLHCPGYEKQIAEIVTQQTTRINGGSLHNKVVKIIINQSPPIASYLKDFSSYICPTNNTDILTDSLLSYQDGYLINQIGFASLEEPVFGRTAVRSPDYPHSWCEPLHTVLSQSSFDDDCWWHRRNSPGVFWYEKMV